MFDKHTHRAFAVLVSGSRTAIPVRDNQFEAKWNTMLDMAIEIARLFAADNERFDAESWFEQCGFGKDPVQRATNLVGQLTRADIAAARAAVETMSEHKVTPRHRSTMMIGNQMRLHAWQLDAGEHIIINDEVGVITELHERNNYGQTVIRYITSLLQTAPHVAIVSPVTEFQTVGLIQDN